MKVNLNKTEIIVFRNGGPLRNYERWTLEGTPIRTTSEYIYMGLILTPKLSWSKANNESSQPKQGKQYSVFETVSVSSDTLNKGLILTPKLSWSKANNESSQPKQGKQYSVFETVSVSSDTLNKKNTFACSIQWLAPYSVSAQRYGV